MNQRYRVSFLLEGGTELKHKIFVRSEGALWYAKLVPDKAKRVRIDDLKTRKQQEFVVDSYGEDAKFIKQVEQYLKENGNES